MKLPCLQFYVGDWRKDVGVQSLSYHDRGVWFELLCMMHESEQRGKLILNGKAVGDDAVARLLGLDMQVCKNTIHVLLDSGVASRCPDTGALMSRRMVKDEALRQLRRECGKKGGNPMLVKQKLTIQVNQVRNQFHEGETETETSAREEGGGEKPRFRMPRTETEAAEWSAAAGVPPDFAKLLFYQCDGTGWLDGLHRSITTWSSYAKYRFEKERKSVGNNGSVKAPTVHELRTVIDTKENLMASLKQNYCGEGLSGWHDQTKRLEYFKLKKEADALKQQLSKALQ